MSAAQPQAAVPALPDGIREQTVTYLSEAP